MGLRDRIAEAIEEETTLEWAFGYAAKLLVEIAVTAGVTTVLVGLVGLLTAIIPGAVAILRTLAAVAFGVGEATLPYLEIAMLLTIWGVLFALLYSTLYCNYP